jgi:GxxExxY protein
MLVDAEETTRSRCIRIATVHGAYRMDLVVDAQILVEWKVVERILPVHESQALSYLRLTGLRTALLVNFNVPVLRLGLRRLTNKLLTSMVHR